MKEATPKTVWQMVDQAGNPMSYNHPTYGLFWKWGILFDNGDKGIFNVKDGNLPKFKEGEFANYTIEPSKGDYPHKVTFKDPQYASQETQQSTQDFGPPTTQQSPKREDPERQRLIVRQTCIKAAAEFYAQRNFDINEMLATADVLFDWVMKAESVEAEEMVNDFPPF